MTSPWLQSALSAAGAGVVAGLGSYLALRESLARWQGAFDEYRSSTASRLTRIENALGIGEQPNGSVFVRRAECTTCSSAAADAAHTLDRKVDHVVASIDGIRETVADIDGRVRVIEATQRRGD